MAYLTVNSTKQLNCKFHPHCFLPCVQDITDKIDYLNSLGKAQTAAIKRDVASGVAEAERDASIKVRVQFLIPGLPHDARAS